MSYTFATYTTALAKFMGVAEDNVDFLSVRPTIIQNAELRILRDVDPVSTVAAVQFPLTGLNRALALPDSGTVFAVIDQVNLISPDVRITSGGDTRTTSDGSTRIVGDSDSGARTPLVPLALDAIVQLYPSVSAAATPRYFHYYNNEKLIFGPWPDVDYTVEVVGRVRPETLSATNTTTFIATHLPDLFLAASMVVAAGYQKNFSAMADAPQGATTWEGHYKTLLIGAGIEEVRRKFQAQAWSSKSPSPLATPPRS